MLEQLVTTEARRHGDYRVETITKTAGEFAPDEVGEAPVIRNRGGTAIDRWAASGALDDRQMGAISLYRRAHTLVFGVSSVGMDWSRFLTAGVRAARWEQVSADNAIDAKDDLIRMDRILKWHPRVEETWINVVLHDQPAGMQGGLLRHETEKAARASALTVIRFCCDLIAGEFRL